MRAGNLIKLVDGVPKERDFASDTGTPLIIDASTGFGYYYDGIAVRTLQTGPASVVGAFSNGFNSGFA